MRAQPSGSLQGTKYAYPGNVQNSGNMVQEIYFQGTGGQGNNNLGGGYANIRWVFQGNSSYQYFDANTMLDCDL